MHDAFGEFKRQQPARRLALVDLVLALPSSPIASSIMHEAGECAAAWHTWLSRAMGPASSFVHFYSDPLHFISSSFAHCLSL